MTEQRESVTREIWSFEDQLIRSLITLRRLAVTGFAATLFQVTLGGWIRATRIKPLCPDWPTCFGRWIPPLSASDLPSDINPADFDFLLAWMEFLLRASGIGIFALICFTTYFAVKRLHHISSVFFSSIGIMTLLILEIWIGSQFSYLFVQPMVVSLHTGIAFVLLSLMAYQIYHSYLNSEPSMRVRIQQPVMLRRWLSGVWIISLFQIVMGCEVRLHFLRLIEIFPKLSRYEISHKMTDTVHLHGWLGFMMAVFTAYVSYRIIRLNGNIVFIRSGAWSLALINMTQLLTGAALVTLGVPVTAQVLHTLLSALFMANLVILYLSLKPRIF